MKELNKLAYVDADFSINLSIDYEDEHGEFVELEDVRALDFLETIGYDEIVMQKIWEAIADSNFWGMFDVECDCGVWVSIKWDICDNTFTVSADDDDYVELTFKEFYNEFFAIFEGAISYASAHYRLCLFHYWDTVIDLDDYPNILNKIEKAGA